MVTIRQIAKKAGYSAATVSRLLNNDPTFSIAEDTKNKILQVASELGYTGHQQQLPLRTIAIFFAITPKEELEDVYYNALRKNLQNAAERMNMNGIFYNSIEDALLSADKFDSFIAVGNFKQNELAQLNSISTNGVFIDSNPNPGIFSSVQPDLHYITTQAINQFRHNGFTKIGFIGGRYYNPDTGTAELDEREKIFRNYLFELNQLDERYIFSSGHFSVETGYKLGLEVITKLHDHLPDGFFVASDPIAIGVLQAFNENGVTVPKDTAIISINDIDVAKYVSPPLTTFNINLQEISRVAINLINDNILNQNTNCRRILISADLIIRKSFIPV